MHTQNKFSKLENLEKIQAAAQKKLDSINIQMKNLQKAIAKNERKAAKEKIEISRKSIADIFDRYSALNIPSSTIEAWLESEGFANSQLKASMISQTTNQTN